jgi:hypothetical protein
MKRSKHKIQTHLGAKGTVSYDREKLQETIKAAKRAFLENEAESSLSRLEFLCRQSRYIRKHWWVLQGCILILLWLLLNLSGSSIFFQKCMGAFAPLFAVLVLPELWKNRNANAMEIECTACFSLRQIYGARIFLFALVDLLLLGSFALAAILAGKLSAEELIIQFFLPYLVTCCICFRTLYSPRITSEALAILLCVAFSFLWIQFVLTENIYSIISLPLWLTMTAIAACYLGYCIGNGQKNCVTIWEVKAQWN